MKQPKSTKTFPLEIEEELHKRLKIEAIKENKSLHSLIIETLAEKVQESTSVYKTTRKERKGK